MNVNWYGSVVVNGLRKTREKCTFQWESGAIDRTEHPCRSDLGNPLKLVELSGLLIGLSVGPTV